MLGAANLSNLPPDDLPEIAFAGRSNSGKSTALNTLCGQKSLARVSKTPGRTQLLNLFELPGRARLVDLPGYGFAKVPHAVRDQWGKMVGGYIQSRANLRGLVVIMDCRHPLTAHDQQMLSWVGGAGLPCQILLSKADKLGFGAAKNQLLGVRKALRDVPVQAQVQLFSGLKRQGVEEARSELMQMLGVDWCDRLDRPGRTPQG